MIGLIWKDFAPFDASIILIFNKMKHRTRVTIDNVMLRAHTLAMQIRCTRTSYKQSTASDEHDRVESHCLLKDCFLTNLTIVWQQARPIKHLTFLGLWWITSCIQPLICCTARVSIADSTLESLITFVIKRENFPISSARRKACVAFARALPCCAWRENDYNAC